MLNLFRYYGTYQNPINSYLSFSHIMLKPLRTTKFTTYSSLKTPISLFGKTYTHTHIHFCWGFFFLWLNFYSKWLKICGFFFLAKFLFKLAKNVCVCVCVCVFFFQFCSCQKLRFFLGLIARFVYWVLTLVAKDMKD